VSDRVRNIGLAVLVAVLATLVAASAASAANRRISISDYQWSDKDVHIDLDEHVTWYWVGPDTMHSITGDSPNSTGIDSDPDTNQPQHQLGDTFEVGFDQPGTYQFHCKLHSTVKGTVTVSDKPGNPTDEPDPVPESRVDLTPPNLGSPLLSASSFGRNGTALHYSLDEKARLSIDIYRLDPGRKPKFAGWEDYKAGHVGFNNVRFGDRGKHFKPKPGKYRADIIAEDESSNTTRPLHLKFKIWKR